ncbi:replication protein RepA [Gryllotalpicola protaetiae]|uniref:Uncharacterized protein n=1 Tax=Gryllotalpicola protaetiae TaxID=2419771 RepID=A0A387BM12_9MICO|nr:replication protein RepA [Gryllotalpicola protaetiae]AYG02239.1 hypothetical protein D7I44_00955 [Gryllotalpicola protaetiae]
MGLLSRLRKGQEPAASAPPTAHETGHVKLMIIFGIPLTDPAEEQSTPPGMIVRGDWKRIVTMRPDEYGYPYGVIPRRIMLWLARRARETGSPVIELGATPQDFVAELGLPSAAVSDVLWQAQRLFGASITLGDATVGKRTPTAITMRVAESFRFWDGQAGQVTLADHLFRSITEHQAPLDWEAVRNGDLSAMAIDVYGWLSLWVQYNTSVDSERLGWGRLHELFGHRLPMPEFEMMFADAANQAAPLVSAATLEALPDGALVRRRMHAAT